MAVPTSVDLDLAAVRAQFPALGLHVNGDPVVYLDNPAGTQVPQRVIDRTAEYWRTMNANHGGVFATSARSDARFDEVRRAAAAFINAPAPEEIVFGANMTTLTFAFSRAIARELKPGDEIVVTRLEHDGNISPWLALTEQGIHVRVAEITVPDCRLDMADLQRQISPRTRLVAVTHASNAVGTIPDLKAVARLAHAVGAWLWVDAVHYGPHGLIDVQAIDCDFLVCSSYKFYGPAPRPPLRPASSPRAAAALQGPSRHRGPSEPVGNRHPEPRVLEWPASAPSSTWPASAGRLRLIARRSSPLCDGSNPTSRRWRRG